MRFILPAITVVTLVSFASCYQAFAKTEVLFNGFLTIERLEYTPPQKQGFLTEVEPEDGKAYRENDAGQIRRVVNMEENQILSFLGTGLRDYQLYVPKKYSESKAAPVIVLLHDVDYTGVSLVEKWKPFAELSGSILVGPTARNNNWLITESEADFIAKTVEDVSKDYNVNRERVYLFGHGRGSILATYMPIFKPDLFASVVSNRGYFSNMKHARRLQGVKVKTPVVFIGYSEGKGVDLKKIQDTARTFAEWEFPTHMFIYENPNLDYYKHSDEINLRTLKYISQFKK